MASASIGDPQSFNRYGYVLNNPINSTDPTGRCPKGRKCHTDKAPNGEVTEYYDDEDGNVVMVGPTANAKAPPMFPLIASLLGMSTSTEFQVVYRSSMVLRGTASSAAPAAGAAPGIFGKLFGAIGLILSNPISIGCGQTRNSISDGNGGCMHDPSADNKVDTSENKKDDSDSKVEGTPETEPDKFEPVRGRDAKRNKATKEIWVKDRLHKDHYEVYKNLRKFERGTRDRAVWSDGRAKPL